MIEKDKISWKGRSALNYQQAEEEKVIGKYSAIANNVQAVKALIAAVEGTIGPKGMDCMLVNEEGDFIITNDGVTILMEMDVSHPAAIMLINGAYAQQKEIGDGTTTMTILVGQLLESALYHIQKGVSVHHIIQGIRLGIKDAIQYIEDRKIAIIEENWDMLKSVIKIAGREDESLIELLFKAANFIGKERLLEKDFRFSDMIEAVEGLENEVLPGVIIYRKPTCDKFKSLINEGRIMILDDELQVEALSSELMGTENGFNQYIENREKFDGWIQKIIDLDISALFIGRTIDPHAEQQLLDAGILVVSNILSEQLNRLSQCVGAKLIKNSVLSKRTGEIEVYCGKAAQIIYDAKLDGIKVIDGAGSPAATVLVSAATGVVTKERERVARDAAASLQAAVKEGVVVGGGASELACATLLEKMKNNTDNMTKYGIACVIDALKKPMYNIIKNAGFNPLEKVENVTSAIKTTGCHSLGINCDNGEIEDLLKKAVLDPALVKIYALKTSCEIAEAILKIHLILKGRSYQ